MPSRREVLTYLVLLAVTSLAAWGLGSVGATGLRAAFWRNADWAGEPATTTIGSLPAIEYFVRDGPPAGAGPASAEWTGFFAAPRAGTYEFEVASDDGAWERVLLPEWEHVPPDRRLAESNRRYAQALLDAIAEDREPQHVCSGRDALAALEMVLAPAESQRVGRRVSFPLTFRGNPYAAFAAE